MSHYGPEFQNRSPEMGGVRVRNSVDLGGFFSILRRQRFWIFVGIAIAFGLAFVYIFLAPLTYTSTISILIDARDRQPVGSDQPSLPQQADPLMVESQLKLMTSDGVLRRVVREERLESDPEFSISGGGGLSSLISRGAITAPAIDQIAEQLFQRISVKRPDRTYVVEMDVRASNPGKAARLADAVARAFLEEEKAAATAYVNDQAEWVTKRTAELGQKVEQAEKRVQDYKADNGIINVAGTMTQEQQLQEANRDLVATRAKSGEAQSRVDQIKRIIASGKALDGTYDTINSTVIRQLRVQYSDLVRRQAAASQKYGTRHPEYLDIQEQLQAVRSEITNEMQRISSALTNEAQVARSNEDAAQKRVQILESRTTASNQTGLQLRELERQAESDRTAYEKFLRAKDSIRRDPTEQPYARVVAPASFPTKPSSPKVMAALLIAASGGLSLGIGLAVWKDYGQTGQTGGATPTPGPARRPGPTTVFNPLHFARRDPPGGNGPGQYSPPPQSGNDRAAHTGFYRLFGRVLGLNQGTQETASEAARRGPATFAPRSSIYARSPAEDVHAMPSASSPAEARGQPGTSIDPRDLVSGLIGDLSAGRSRRIILSSQHPSSQKTELAMTLARAAANNGHSVLVIDGDEYERTLSRSAIRDGLPARIHFDKMEINVLGIPADGEGVVFVLPHQAVTGDLAVVDSPFIQCRVAAVIVDGPALGPALAAFQPIADTCYILDDTGYLHLTGLADAIHPYADPRDARLAQVRYS